MNRLLPLALLTLLSPGANATGLAGQPFELKDGDVVVFLGGTFVERDLKHGYLETLLNCRWPDRNFTFRNLGWSGDTVFGHARAGFGSVEDGFQLLKKQVFAVKPTVIFLAYGANESFDGEAGLPNFLKGLDRLLDELGPTKVRWVFLSPLLQEDLGKPLPDPARHNEDVRRYALALKATAEKRGAWYVDLLLVKRESAHSPPLTENEIHLTGLGYRKVAEAIEAGLGLESRRWTLGVGHNGQVRQAQGVHLSQIKAGKTSLRFEGQLDALPAWFEPGWPGGSKSGHAVPPALQVHGLPPGKYLLKIDGRRVAQAAAERWDAGMPITKGPDYDQAEACRQAILAKNELYFHRWRPENETYLFGFRKYEQGQNAKEVAEQEPLVARQEGVISQLRKPTAHVYELVREKESKER